MTFLLVWYGVFTFIAFCLMGADKSRAKEGKWRVPEHTLIAFAYLGGFVGYYLGMYTFHHKTRKWYFHLHFLLSAVVHGGLLYLLYRLGILL